MNKDKIKYLVYKVLPLNAYLKFIYKWYHGKPLNLKKPRLYTEKLFWLKKYNGETENLGLIQKCYDKYNIRQFVEAKKMLQIMPKLYGVYKDSGEIEFDKLPKKYVLKISQSCGFNFINNGTIQLNEMDTKETLQKWLNLSKDKVKMKKLYKEESYYFDGSPLIICEEYLECADGTPCVDYGVFCFNGEPQFISCDIDAVDGSGLRKKQYFRNVFDLNWNIIPVDLGRERNEEIKVSIPENFEKMIEISRKLSEDFVFARIDLYNRDGEIFLGEITFIPQGASQKIQPEEFDVRFGELLTLPIEREKK